MTVTLSVKLTFFRAWLRFLMVLTMCRLLSDEQALRLAVRGTWLVLFRLDRGRWRFLREKQG